MKYARHLSARLIRWISLCVWCSLFLAGSINVGQSASPSLPSHVLRPPGFQLPWLRSISDSPSSLSLLLTGNISNHMAFDFLVPPMPQSGGSKIVYASNRDGSMQIYSMNADGSAQSLQEFIKYEREIEQLKGFGDEAYLWGYGLSNFVFRRGRFNVYVSTVADVDDDADVRTLTQSEKNQRMRTEMKRLSREFAKHVSTAIDIPD